MKRENRDDNQMDPFIKKIMIVTTIVGCIGVVLFVIFIHNPQEIKDWRDNMAKQDCNILGTYLINNANTPNYTKIASDNIQFVYSVYQEKQCTPLH